MKHQRLSFGLSDVPLPGLQAPAAASSRHGPATAEPHYHRHRDRLRGRLMQSGPASLADYELLELVLFRAIPRQDVKPLAKRLLAEFGDFNRIIAAPAARLCTIQGVGDAVVRELKIVEAAAHRMAQARVLGQNAISSWTELMRYCKTCMAHRDTEQFRILFLDRRNMLIADEEQSRGTVDHVPVYPREVARRALDLNATAMILVHNHPSGDPTPSQSDIEMTDRIREAVEPLGVVLHDHVIIGKERDTSFRSQGYL